MSVSVPAHADEPPRFPFPSSHASPHLPDDYSERLAQAPVSRVRLPDGQTAWLVVRHHDVRTVLTDPRFSRRAAALAEGGHLIDASVVGEVMLGFDPPEHTALRRPVAGLFTVRRAEALRPAAAALADGLVDALRDGPYPGDLMAGVCEPLPSQVMCTLLGVPDEDRERFVRLAHAVVLPPSRETELTDGVPSPKEAMGALFAELAALAAAKRAAGPTPHGGGVIGDLATAEDGPDDQRIALLAFTLLGAGVETTVGQLGLCFHHLLTRPERLASVPRDASGLAAFTDELLRMLPINHIGGTLTRMTTEPVELSGVTIPAGALVIAATVAANSDPAAFPEPRVFRADRPQAGNLAFGHGPHRCLGAALATVEIQEALRAVAERLHGIRPADPDTAPALMPTTIVCRFERLPVVW